MTRAELLKCRQFSTNAAEWFENLEQVATLGQITSRGYKPRAGEVQVLILEVQLPYFMRESKDMPMGMNGKFGDNDQKGPFTGGKDKTVRAQNSQVPASGLANAKKKWKSRSIALVMRRFSS